MAAICISELPVVDASRWNECTFHKLMSVYSRTGVDDAKFFISADIFDKLYNYLPRVLNLQETARHVFIVM